MLQVCVRSLPLPGQLPDEQGQHGNVGSCNSIASIAERIGQGQPNRTSHDEAGKGDNSGSEQGFVHGVIIAQLTFPCQACTVLISCNAVAEIGPGWSYHCPPPP